MKSRLLNESRERVFVLVFETGDEVASELLRFAGEQNLEAAHFIAVGACERATLGFFDLTKKDYEMIPMDEQVEVMSLIGNIALYNREPRIHAHIVVGKRDGTAYGGHLISAHVRPTLELFLTELPVGLSRSLNEATKLPLIDLNE